MEACEPARVDMKNGTDVAFTDETEAETWWRPKEKERINLMLMLCCQEDQGNKDMMIDGVSTPEPY